MKKRKISEAQKELNRRYTSQRRRINQWRRRAIKSGFVVPEDILPKRPKKVTVASIRRLERLTPERLAAKSEYVTPEGEVIPGAEGLKRRRKDAPLRKEPQRQEAPEEPSVPDARLIAVENLKRIIDEAENPDPEVAQRRRGMLYAEMNKAINREGELNFGQRLIDEWDQLPDNVVQFVFYTPRPGVDIWSTAAGVYLFQFFNGGGSVPVATLKDYE